jgi:hypothetical protein
MLIKQALGKRVITYLNLGERLKKEVCLSARNTNSLFREWIFREYYTWWLGWSGTRSPLVNWFTIGLRVLTGRFT